MPGAYDRKYLIKCLAGLVVMAGLMRVSKGAAFAIVPALILFAAIRGKPVALLNLLMLSIAMLIGNGNIMPKGPIFGYAQRASMMLASALLLIQIFGRRNAPILKPMLGLFPYLVWMALVSIAGWCPFISYLKLILFTSVFLAYYGISNLLANARHVDPTQVRSVFLALAIFFIFGSMFLLPFPAIAELNAEERLEMILQGKELTSLFMGMTFHSQSLGPVCAMLGTALFADLVFGVRRADKLYLALLLCAPLLIWKTSSRTAMGTFLFGIGLCTWFAFGARLLASRWRGKIITAMATLGLAALLAVALIPAARDKVAAFVMKYDHNTTLSQVNTEDVFSTRRGKWEEGIYHFRRSPLIGNGFQVSEDMCGLKPSLKTLSAPVEKSVWISAVLEEGGVPGFILFTLFLIVAALALKHFGAYIGLAIFLSLVVMNLGEFTFFSMSSFGGFAWAMVFIGLTLDAARHKAQPGFN